MRFQTLALSSLALLAAIALADCGGGSGSGAVAYPTATAAPTVAPSGTPTSTPTLAPAGSTTLPQATLLGSPGFTNTNNFTVYTLSDDTVTSLACTQAAGCLGIWPPVSPPAGVALSTGFTTFVRPDTGQTQLAFNNHPVYQYSGDAAAGQTNGNNLVSFGGTWSIARP